MRYRLSLLLLLLSSMLSAQVQFGETRYSLRFDAGYAYNRTYGSYGTFDVGAFMPINPHFEMQADCRMATVNTYSLGIQLRPKFALPTGEMYLETRAMYCPIMRSRIHEFDGGLSLGYRMDYVDVQVGYGFRTMQDMDLNYNSSDPSTIFEAINVLYRLQVYVRPHTSPWNISFVFSNMNPYQVERMWQPLFMLNGHYCVSDHWQVHLSALCKPTGMFHLNAAFYGADVRAGFSYRF